MTAPIGRREFITREPSSGLVMIPDTFTIAHRGEITALAARHRLPAVYPFRMFAEAGGLLSYGNDPVDNCRRAATYVDRVLKGATPSELAGSVTACDGGENVTRQLRCPKLAARG
jgi:ABC-type uncharacterized transport system substrate-binding protein